MADATSAAQKDPVKLTLKSSPYGKVLFANGFAAYVFTADGDSGSACSGECASQWPPLRASEVVAGEGVRRGLIGETIRDDGSKQLTYAGSPIYLWYEDPRGEVFATTSSSSAATGLPSSAPAARRRTDPQPVANPVGVRPSSWRSITRSTSRTPSPARG